MNTPKQLILLPICFGVLLVASLIAAGVGFSQSSLTTPQACVPGPHSGVITGTQQWCAANSPHLLSGDVTVPAGITLTIEAGVTVQGADNAELLVQGHLEALGLAAQPITFTSLLNSGPGEWAGVAFDSGSGYLRQAIVRYAGDRNTVTDAALGSWARSNIAIRNVLTGEVRLENTTIRDISTTNQDIGVYAGNSNLIIEDSLFTEIGQGSYYVFPDAALYIAGGDSDVSLTNNTFTANNYNNIVLQAGAMMNHDAILTPQNGLDGYVFENDFTVPSAVTLTVEPGVTLMGANSLVELLVMGHLETLGTAVQPITFTSLADSGPGEWAGLAFDGGTGHLRYTTVRYGGERNAVTDALLGAHHRSNLAIRNGTLQLEHATVRDLVTSSYDYGLVASDSHLIINDSLFTGIGGSTYAESDVPMRLLGPDTVLEMSGCTFSGNVNDRVLLDPGAMMGHDTVLAAQPALDGYEYRDDFTVPPTVTLTLEPGVTFMSGIGGWNVPHEFIIEGHLQALGTPTQPITFTSVADSGPGQWPGLIFDGGTGHLRHATVRYAGLRNHVTDAGLGAWARSTIAIQDVTTGEVRLDNVTIRDITSNDQDMGVYVGNSNLVAENSLFTGIGNGSIYVFPDTAIYIAGNDSNVTLTNNTFTANNSNTVVLKPGAMMNHNATLMAQNGLDGYVLQEDFTVPLTITLTIAPGVTVMGGDNDVELRIEGHLDAIGAPDQPITFTSFNNSDASEWAGLLFVGSEGAGTGRLQHVTVHYAGRGTSIIDGDHRGSNIAVYDVTAGEVRLQDVLLEKEFHFDGWHHFLDHGLYINNSRVVVADSIIENNGDNSTAGGSEDSGVYVTGDSYVLIDDSLIQSNSAPGLLVEGDTAFVRVSGSSIVNNVGDGVRNMGAATVILSDDAGSGNAVLANLGYGVNQAGVNGQVIATYNWWGDASGPTHAGNPPGTGEEVTDRVLYDPWLVEPPAPPPVASQLVQLTGPLHVSPGDTANLGLFFNNLLAETLINTIVVAQLPAEAEYIMSTGGGQYWPQRHQVVWQLGNTAPGATWQAAVQVRFAWGLPVHLHMDYMALIAAENRPNAWMTQAEYRAYTELQIVSQQEVSDAQLTAILSADPDLTALYQGALDMGFAYYGAAQMEQLSNGSERLALVMINTAKPDERIDLYGDASDAVAVHTTSLFEAIYNLTGGYRFYYETGEVESWGAMQTGLLARFPVMTPCAATGCAGFGYNDCLRNCMIRTIPSGQFAAHYSSKCAACYASGEQCQQCAWYMYLLRNDTIKNSLDFCYDSCDEDVDNGKCTESTRECASSHMYMETPCFDCEYVTDSNVWGMCADDQRCINGFCVPVLDPNVDHHPIETMVAGDPNAMYGPPVAAAGQWISYTIAYENVGQGNAHGVYVMSHLPPELDAATLVVTDGGVYLPESRTLLWDVGTLGGGAGGQAEFGAQVSSGIASDTVFVASAVVYFPSVPETTPTNDVVTIVGDVVADAQRVQTVEGTPATITLSGYSPAGGALTYEVLRQPANGILSGMPPNLTYIPADNFEGLDSLSFGVHDGINASLPAEVSIIVNTGVETIPPTVLFTTPAPDATDVQVYDSPAYSGIYHPLIWAQFSEPIDAATLTPATFFITGSDGQHLDGVMEYAGTSHRVTFMLHEPLIRNETYTVTITTGVHDTSGNPLAANYVWHFRAEALQIYLPVLVRQ